ncbi:hypothetical protein [Bosea sp. RAF48]|uniref:hypothetical protein n=1 Tax=Bosea sp. RAF48 TaxID=3237480 RepID=UPI003F90C0A4
MFAEAVLWIARTGSPGLSDNILRPLMLSGGLDVPMPIILIGVIGGMISDGLLGLFRRPRPSSHQLCAADGVDTAAIRVMTDG